MSNKDFSKINVWDMEMCCWPEGEGPKRIGEIISIGIAKLCLVTGKITRDGHYYVRPDEDEVSPFCTELTGITRKMVYNQGRPLQDVIGSVVQKFGGPGAVWVAWGSDDVYLREQCTAKGFSSPIEMAFNASVLYRVHMRSSDPRSIGLEKTLQRHGLEFEGRPHNALNDAINLARLITNIKLF
ncbi:3'-5' exonuclease [Pseudomonas aeruginosa]